MAQFVIRLAVSTDIEKILAIDPSVEARRTFVQGAINRSECFVAEKNGVLLGYGVMNHGFFERGFVRLVYVGAAHRRLGVASCLFDEFEAQCKTGRIFTSTNLSNVPMQAFLVSRGYVLSGLVQDLDEADPEMFYSKRLRAGGTTIPERVDRSDTAPIDDKSRSAQNPSVSEIASLEKSPKSLETGCWCVIFFHTSL